jgi:hypothetical protein
MAEAQAEARKFKELLHRLHDHVSDIETTELRQEALMTANVAGHAVSATDAATWHAATSD